MLPFIGLPSYPKPEPNPIPDLLTTWSEMYNKEDRRVWKEIL